MHADVAMMRPDRKVTELKEICQRIAQQVLSHHQTPVKKMMMTAVDVGVAVAMAVAMGVVDTEDPDVQKMRQPLQPTQRFLVTQMMFPRTQ